MARFGLAGKHTFYPVDVNEVEAAERRLGRRFPGELRTFFLEIGYGFLRSRDKGGVNRIMDPGSLADFVLGEGIHEGDPDREMYADARFLPFFEVGDGVYLTLSLDEAGPDGVCPVYYFDTKIADSIRDFITRMDEQPGYFADM